MSHTIRKLVRREEGFSAETLDFLVEKPGTIIIDVRDPSEYKSGHIFGAHNLPCAQIYGEPSLLEHVTTYIKETNKGYEPEHDGHTGKNNLVLVYCDNGFERSPSVAALLCDQGYAAAYLIGGYIHWRYQHHKENITTESILQLKLQPA